MQQLVLKLSKVLEREAECWQSGLFLRPTLSQDVITGTKRNEAVVWMIEKSDMFNFYPETWALSVTILDRFLHVVKAQGKYLQCIAITCLFIAAKFSEEDEAQLTAAELVLKSRCGFSASDIVRMERIIVDKLQWNIRSATPLEFLYIFHALLKSTDLQSFINTREANEQMAVLVARARQCASCHLLLGYRPSILALSILSLQLEHSHTPWLPTIMALQQLTSIDNMSLVKCREKISYMVPSFSQVCVNMVPQISRAVKRKMRCVSETISSDEDMYEGIKRLYTGDEDVLGGVKIGCGAEAMQPSSVGRDMATTTVVTIRP